MRCNYCNVDLEDSQRNCPLCGKPAVNEKQHISRVTAPYPTQDSEKAIIDNKN